MKKYSFQTQLYPLLLLFICVTVGNAQPKMIRTQGKESGNMGCELQDKTATFGSAQEVLA